MKQRPHGISVCWLVIAFAFAAAVLFLLAGTASARTITVAKDGSGEHTKIQDGIDAAEDGDTVYVKEGTYNENVVVDKTINLMGVSRENTTIDAGGSGDVVKITADRVNISGFAVTGGGNSHAGIQINSDHNTIADNNCSNNKFLAIRFDTSSHNTISNNICANNRNGIILVSSDYNAVLNNICLNKYQAILLSSSNHNTVLNNTCSNNTIDLYESDYNIISNNTCNSNNDYGICITGSDHNTISNNTCSNDDFGIFFNSSDHNTISNNTCTNNNFGILLDGSDHNTISNNNCSNNAYNGISLQGCDYNLISNNTISGNGVGIRLIHNSQNNTIHRNNIYNNTQYGINATYKNIFTINATGNWWFYIIQ
ncbi:MAG: right-handed parallel beta-helix repeat-containing protein [Thermoplasmata archaeon]|nr:right-handed parallel beta-helix repeat-containing protein [Thermoplasmata archaeon]